MRASIFLDRPPTASMANAITATTDDVPMSGSITMSAHPSVTGSVHTANCRQCPSSSWWCCTSHAMKSTVQSLKSSEGWR